MQNNKTGPLTPYAQTNSKLGYRHGHKASNYKTTEKVEVQVSPTDTLKCLESLAIKEMQIKTTMRFHITPIRMVVRSENQNPINVGKDMGRIQP